MQLPLCSYWLSAFQASQKNYRKALLIVVDRRERHCLCKSLNLKDAINSAARAWSDILETTLPRNYHGILLKKVREKGGSPPFLISSETKDHSSKGTLVLFLWWIRCKENWRMAAVWPEPPWTKCSERALVVLLNTAKAGITSFRKESAGFVGASYFIFLHGVGSGKEIVQNYWIVIFFFLSAGCWMRKLFWNCELNNLLI